MVYCSGKLRQSLVIHWPSHLMIPITPSMRKDT
jgi:hypothetical protein